MNININTIGYTGNGIQADFKEGENIVRTENRQVEIVKAAVESVISQADLQNETVDKILSDLGFKVNEENKTLVNMLMKDGKAVTKENLTQINRFVRLVGTENADKALFFMNNDVKPTFENGEKLTELANHSFQMSAEAEKLTEAIESLFDDTVLRNEILNKLADDIPEKSILKNNGFENAVLKLTENINTELENIKVGDNIEKTDVFVKSQTLVQGETARQVSSGAEETTLPIQKFATENKEVIFNILKDSVLKGDGENFEKEILILGKGVFDDKEVLGEIFKDNPQLRETVEKVLFAQRDFKKLIKGKLNFDVREKNSEKLESFVKELKNTVNVLKESLGNTNLEKYSTYVKTADNILNKLDFMNELKNTAMLQIPVIINNKEETAEIYVFNNRKGRSKKGKSVSAVISLDTAYIGHFEAYAVKDGRNVNIQFRVNENTQKIIKDNIEILINYFKNKNLNLQGYSFKNIDERFSVIDKEPEINKISERAVMNFAFDKLT